ncbi:CYTH and CHAD domain-containing protein [Amaricoccus sp.]|uniref:CYTH and CHAD domain-containing protein n=1 Tax=Amaricoccus sp. TaxID=1872485 RepID=UPI001B416C50|nr:CYTH and CHAD domain-containing protein [Amaricoccus sp.]MBP7241110.1 CHAD domain-containing protein [Amaricoccus sp.]
MIETELKIALDHAEAARLARSPALPGLREGPRQRKRLVSIYVDTAGHALAEAGVALRLRRIGRRWVQTVKRGRRAGGAGLFSQEEIEVPAPGGRLALGGPDPSGAYAAIAEATGGAPLQPVFETRVERIIERLRMRDGVVELALDRGEVVSGGARAPILEAEIELIDGEIAAVFDLARLLFPNGPVRFATANKSALGYRLARGEPPPGPPRPRNAGTVAFDAETNIETAARDVLRDCFAQVAQNLVVTLASDDHEGPHQLRVGLRRLRTALAVFGPSLGAERLGPLSAAAQRLGRVVGRLRDADVLMDEVVAGAAGTGLDAPARAALDAALAERRHAIRAEVRAHLAGSETTGFVFDLLETIEARGWLDPADYAQTARLATPVAERAPVLLDARLRKAVKRGRRIETRDAEALHELRKELKKLRYAAEMLGPVFPRKKVEAFLRPLKDLQDAFGSLNDGAMATGKLTGDDAPGAGDPAVQRAVGWTLGVLSARAQVDRPRLFERWRTFGHAAPFWR